MNYGGGGGVGGGGNGGGGGGLGGGLGGGGGSLAGGVVGGGGVSRANGQCRPASTGLYLSLWETKVHELLVRRHPHHPAPSPLPAYVTVTCLSHSLFAYGLVHTRVFHQVVFVN